MHCNYLHMRQNQKDMKKLDGYVEDIAMLIHKKK